jgi:hypothetical protein
MFELLLLGGVVLGAALVAIAHLSPCCRPTPRAERKHR